MGRKPSLNHHLPPRMRAAVQRSGNTYYYYDAGGKPRKWIPLGADYIQAVKKWATLDAAPCPVQVTVAYAILKYRLTSEYLDLTGGTQADYGYAFDKLIDAFGDAPLDCVTPAHLKEYHKLRCVDSDKWKGSKHRANRELQILGMIFRFARGESWTTNDPKEPVKLKKLPGRENVYIYDEMLSAVYNSGSIALKDAMDLAYVIGQRPADCLSMSIVNIRGDMLEYRQSKTGKGQRVKICNALADLLQRIEARKTEHKVHSLYLLVDERGLKMTKAKLRSRFEQARTAAGIAGADFQFRDLRRKAGSDIRDEHSLEVAQKQLGHKKQDMTEHYTGGRGTIFEKVVTKLPHQKTHSALQKN
jgi:integrase